jgi:hypothetical protein
MLFRTHRFRFKKQGSAWNKKAPHRPPASYYKAFTCHTKKIKTKRDDRKGDLLGDKRAANSNSNRNSEICSKWGNAKYVTVPSPE